MERVTLQSIVQSALTQTRRLSDRLASLQAQSASGKRFEKISDDPTAALTVLAAETQTQTFATHLENIKSATSTLNMSVATLQQSADVLAQARAIAIEASSSVQDEASYAALAGQVDALLDRLLSLANTQHQDRYLFGGSGERTPPFVVTQRDANGRPSEIRYQGSHETVAVTVDRGQQVALDYVGDAIFARRQRQEAVFTGRTGASPGTGTDNATGRGELQVRHLATTYAAGSGVLPGAGSAAGDTILGPAGRHRLHITDTSGTGAFGTVKLDDGAEVAFTSADTNLRVSNAAGDVVYVNLSAVAAGFSGDIDITATGTLSLDGGATTTPITFAANQGIVNSDDGTVTYIDSTSITRAGDEGIDHPGTSDAFQALIALRDDLRNTRGLSGHGQIEAISRNIDELQRVHGNILQTLGEQSASLQGLDSLQKHLEDLQLSAKQTAADLGGVDLSEIVVNLQAYQNMLQLSLATFARLADQSLLDFLR